jgi:hypothetical protein
MEIHQSAVNLDRQPRGDLEKRLTRASMWRKVNDPMARHRTAELMLLGLPLSSFGAPACRPGSLDHEQKPGRRDLALAGEPVERW